MPRKIQLAGQLYEDEREVLRLLIDWRKRLLDSQFGSGTGYVPPISTEANALFTKLGKKYKYDSEFSDALHGFDFKSHSTRSRKH